MEQVVVRVNQLGYLRQQNVVVDRSEVVGDVPFHQINRTARRTQNRCDLRLAGVEPVGAVAVREGSRGEPCKQALIQNAVEKEIDDALLPGRDVERAALAVEVVFQADRWPKAKLFFC